MSAGAGEILLRNGSRLEGELASDVLLVATASGLVEVVPEEVVLLAPGEVRLQDGRVILGSVVGDRLKTRTALGEMAIPLDELQVFSTTRPVAKVGAGSGGTWAPAADRTSAARSTAPDAVRPASDSVTASVGRPSLAAYARPDAGGQTGRSRATEPAPAGPVVADVALAMATPEAEAAGEQTRERRLEVLVGESALYRDAYTTAVRVGRVVRGQLVTYLDFIDRRLRILNALIFDGGYWIKVRATDGTEGWVPAETVREVR